MHSSAPHAASADAANAAEIADRLAALSMRAGGLIPAPAAAAAASLAPGSSRGSSSSSSSRVSSHTSPHASPLLPLGAAAVPSARSFASSTSPWAPTADQKFAAPFPAASGCVCESFFLHLCPHSRMRFNFIIKLLISKGTVQA